MEKSAHAGRPAPPPPFRDLTLGAQVVLVTFAAYASSLGGALIWNDSDYVTAPALRSLRGLGRIWFDVGATQQYYPLLHSAFWLQHRLWGDSALGYHMVAVALHALCAVLLALTLRALVGEDRDARYAGFEWLAAFLFAVHPVHVETVAWVSEQKNTLSLAFYLAAALAYMGFDRTGSRRTYAWASAFFVLSLLCKTVTVTLPAALLVCLWYKRGKLVRRDFSALGPWLLVGAAAGMFSSWVERSYGGAQGAEFALSFAGRVIVAGKSVIFYLGSLVWPFHLDFIYRKWPVDASDALQWLAPVAVLILAGGLWMLRKRTRAPLAAFLFFVGSLFPVLGFVNLYGARYSWVWDHWQYLPDLGPIALAAAFLMGAWRRLPAALRPLGSVGAAALVLGLGALTWSHSQMFSDNETLYRENLALNPDSWLSHDNVGVGLQAQGRVADAIAQYRTAIRLDPQFAEAYNNLGTALALDPARQEEAAAAYGEAIKLKPDFADARYNLANSLNALGRHDEAIAAYQAALAIRPSNLLAHYNLANTLAALGRTDEAIAQFRDALAIDPDFAPAHNNLGLALAGAGKTADAVAEYQEALRLQPNIPEAHANLGLALVGTPGRLGDAVSQFETALSLRPNYPEAHFYLANALVDQGNFPEAAAHFQEALRIRPAFPEACTSFGMLVCRSGHIREGLQLIDAAIRMNPSYPQAHFARGAALLQEGRPTEAIEEFSQVLRLRPGDPAAERMLAMIHSRQ